jgi:hypothetical protein
MFGKSLTLVWILYGDGIYGTLAMLLVQSDIRCKQDGIVYVRARMRMEKPEE